MTSVTSTSTPLSNSDDQASAASSLASNGSVMIGSFVLALLTLLAGLPTLGLAFFGATAGSLFSMLIDHREDIADARTDLLENESFGLV